MRPQGNAGRTRLERPYGRDRESRAAHRTVADPRSVESCSRKHRLLLGAVAAGGTLVGCRTGLGAARPRVGHGGEPAVTEGPRMGLARRSAAAPGAASGRGGTP